MVFEKPPFPGESTDPIQAALEELIRMELDAQAVIDPQSYEKMIRSLAEIPPGEYNAMSLIEIASDMGVDPMQAINKLWDIFMAKMDCIDDKARPIERILNGFHDRFPGYDLTKRIEIEGSEEKNRKYFEGFDDVMHGSMIPTATQQVDLKDYLHLKISNGHWLMTVIVDYDIVKDPGAYRDHGPIRLKNALSRNRGRVFSISLLGKNYEYKWYHILSKLVTPAIRLEFCERDNIRKPRSTKEFLSWYLSQQKCDDYRSELSVIGVEKALRFMHDQIMTAERDLKPISYR